MKKTLALVLAFLMLFSNTALAAVGPVKEPNRTQKPNVKTSISKEEAVKFDANEKVRVIVEVEGAPAIEYATQQGKKFSELSEAKKSELQNKALQSQELVKSQLKSSKVNMQFKESFTTAFNGFSGVVEFGKIESISKLDGVTNVTVANEYERPEAQPDMKYSKEIVQAQKAWDEYGYKGEGMIVGVIDSGIDPTHKDMVLTDATKADLTQEEVETFVSENSLPGKYYTAKVPYGYNYMDKNAEIRDLGPGASMHGMHVSGTVAANGDEENGGIKGVAPEAQLLALKVFGNDPDMGSTWGDIYIKAIDDAIILGADVINMSLGSTASFVNENDPEQQAIANAVDNGVLMSISAGNSAHLGNGYWNPYASNPDIGVVGAPGLSTDSLQVASIDNNFMDLDAVQATFDGVVGTLHPFLSASTVHPNDLETKTFDLVHVGGSGIGVKDDWAGVDYTGKFVLVKRGNSFVDTAFNAQDAGAAGVIVYNHSDGYVNMASDPGITIPQLFMLKVDGEALKAKLDAGVAVTLSFNGDVTTAPNPTAGKMSDFTSWGVTPNLDFKPEITAPGGNIYSTFNDDTYGVMSGTSMAAPHVSGGSALVLQRVDAQFGLEGQARVEMAKNILMNTAAPVVDKGYINTAFGLGSDYSPRRQGAGVMQLHSALSTPVVVTETTSGIGKVALKEVDDTFGFTLEATNYSDEAVTYDVAANVQTDLALFGELGYMPDEIESQPIEGAVVTINGGSTTVEIPANGTVTVDVAVDLTNATVLNPNASDYVDPDTIFPNGYFVEGFVTFTNDAQPELTVPYVGFNGDWNAAPVVDPLGYDDVEQASFYEMSSMLYEGEDGYYYLGHNPFATEDDYYGRTLDRIAISPNGDGVQDEIIPLLSFLRNAKEVKYNVLDADKKLLRTVRTEQNVRKHYYDGGLGAMYSLNPANGWDGTVKKQVVADGQYYFEIASTIDYPGKDAQKVQVSVTVDTVAPTVSGSVEGTTLSLNAADELSGVSYVEVFVDGESLGIVPGDTTELELEGLTADSEVVVVAVDNAGNTTENNVTAVDDQTNPVILVSSPGTFSIHNTNEVVVAGTVTDDSEIATFTVQGKDTELVWNEEAGNYSFETTVTFADGANSIEIVAVDVFGNTHSLTNSRLFFVDTTAPEITVNVPKFVDNNVESVELSAVLSDNAEELRFFVDDSEVFYQELPGYDMKPISKEVTTELALEPGNNVFELKLVDLAGNTTTKTVEVYRNESDSRVSRVSGDTRYLTSVEVSKKGWTTSDVVVIARGDDYADAIAGVPLAKKFNAPLLLTKPTTISSEVLAEVERLGAKTVYVLGGEAAVNSSVVDQLKAKGVTVKRISGDSRYGTAVAIANVVAPGGVSKAVVASGQNFPDALTVSSYAASQGLPVLLTRANELPDVTAKALDQLGVTKTIVVGGNTVINKDVLIELPNPVRLSGENRYETALAIAKYFDVANYNYYVATGKNFADALSGAALAAKNDAGVVLVRETLTSNVANFLSENAETVTVIGGSVVISNTVVEQIGNLLK